MFGGIYQSWLSSLFYVTECFIQNWYHSCLLGIARTAVALRVARSVSWVCLISLSLLLSLCICRCANNRFDSHCVWVRRSRYRFIASGGLVVLVARGLRLVTKASVGRTQRAVKPVPPLGLYLFICYIYLFIYFKTFPLCCCCYHSHEFSSSR